MYTLNLKSKIFYPMYSTNRKVLLHENVLNYKHKYIIRLIASFELLIYCHII